MSIPPKVLHACFIVAALVFVPVAIDAAGRAIMPGAPVAGGTVEGAQQGVAQRGLQGILTAWQHAVAIRSPPGGIPASVCASDACADEADSGDDGSSNGLVQDHAVEIPFSSGAFGVVGSEEDGVVGYQMRCSAEDAQRACDEAMSAAGWQAFPLGGVCGSTYLKESGERRWALATSSESEGVASVVIRCN